MECRLALSHGDQMRACEGIALVDVFESRSSAFFHHHTSAWDSRMG